MKDRPVNLTKFELACFVFFIIKEADCKTEKSM